MNAQRPAPIPTYDKLLWPTLRAVRELGGSARISEIEEKVAELEGFTDAQLAVLHKDGPRSMIDYRIGWARSHLKGMGLLTNPVRGIWETTPAGREVVESEINPRHRDYVARLRRERLMRRSAGTDASEDEPGTDDGEEDWKERLLSAMLAMSSTAFEQLAERLLRAAGFVNTSITSKGGDGGIDGVGVYRVSLVSFPVYFQCKRYKGTVGADKVRDFRGAMAGRGDRGLLITTGLFTAEARREATRDGAPPIDLIDGEELCELLKKHGLGVRTTERVVEEVEVREQFFKDLG